MDRGTVAIAGLGMTVSFWPVAIAGFHTGFSLGGQGYSIILLILLSIEVLVL